MAIVITVDAPILGKRERDLRNHFSFKGQRSANFEQYNHLPYPYTTKKEISWHDIDWLKSITNLPLILKGIMHPKDAAIALENGVDGIIVSNHGGRQIDTVPATINVLPSIVEVVDGQVPVLIDGGIRRGTDVLKALAFGAQAVCVGRPVVWGLAVGGQGGVQEVLNILRSELELTAKLCGCKSISDIGKEIIY